jgi:Na+/melibiose symporter-like transporter
MRLADCWRGSEIPYALAHASKTLFWTASDIYFAFYLTQVCGLPPLVMGFVLAASYLVNAAADVLLGRPVAPFFARSHWSCSDFRLWCLLVRDWWPVF